MDYPKVIDYSPLHIDAQALHEAVNRYYDDPIGDRVALAIATYANSNGVAFPGFATLAELTGYTYEQISRATHRLQALGILKITRRRAKGASHAHNVYKFCKRLIHSVIDICSAHFIGNLQKWKAAASDVAAAVKQKARAAVDTVVEQAGKLAAVFQEKPELMESPEQAAARAGIAEEPETVEIPAVSDPVQTPTQPIGGGMASQPVAACCTPHVYSSWRDRVAAYREKPVSATVDLSACRR